MSGSSQLEIVLEQMASQAFLPSMIQDNPSLPLGWEQMKTFSTSMPFVPVQGFLAKGPINDSGDIAFALALGITWQGYLSYQTSPFDAKNQIPLPETVAGNPGGGRGKVMPPFVNAYNQARADIWDILQKFYDGSDLPLYICGMSLGGPIAQIAALDLRPGNTGPSEGQTSPADQPAGYVFSSANFGNPDFVSYFNKTVVNQFNLKAGSKAVAVDQFPTRPEDDWYGVAGEVAYLNAAIPEYDVPWLERSDVFYLDALGGTPVQHLVQPGSFSNPPKDFSQTMANTLAKLVGAAYALAQHPQSLVSIAPYQLSEIINADGSPFACVFTSVTDVVVAVRGATTWLEFAALSADSTSVATSFNPDQQAQVHRGAYSIYSAPVSSSDSTLFSDQLESVIKGLACDKNLWFTGHGLGGAVANIAVADYAMNPDKGVNVKAIYTFGSNLFANTVFQQQFNARLQGNSYQIRRVNDTICTSVGMQGNFWPVNNQVVLNGQLAVEESTFHSINGYIRLSDP